MILKKIFKQKALYRFSSFYDYPLLNMPVDKEDPKFQSNYELMSASNRKFEQKIGEVVNYGGTVAHQKLKERNKVFFSLKLAS